MADTIIISDKAVALSYAKISTSPTNAQQYRTGALNELHPKSEERGISFPPVEGKVWRLLTEEPLEMLDSWLHLDFPQGLPASLAGAPPGPDRVIVSLNNSLNASPPSVSTTAEKLFAALKSGEGSGHRLRLKIAEPEDIDIKRPAAVAGMLAGSLHLSQSDEKQLCLLLGAGRLITEYWKMNIRNSEGQSGRAIETFKVWEDRSGHLKAGAGPVEGNPLGAFVLYWHN